MESFSFFGGGGRGGVEGWGGRCSCSGSWSGGGGGSESAEDVFCFGEDGGRQSHQRPRKPLRHSLHPGPPRRQYPHRRIVPVPLRIYKNIPEVTLLAVEGHRLHLPPPDGAGNGVERLPGVVDPEGLHVEGPEAVFAVHDAV